MKIGTMIGFALGSTLGIVAMTKLQQGNTKQDGKEMLKQKLIKILD